MPEVMAGSFVHQGAPQQSRYVSAAIDARRLEQTTRQDMAKQVTDTNVDNIRQNSLRAEMRSAMRADQPATYTRDGVMAGTTAVEQQAGAAASTPAAPVAQVATQASSRVAASLDIDV